MQKKIFLVLFLVIFLSGCSKAEETAKNPETDCVSIESVDACMASNCVVCPPSIEASSLSCQTEEFCQALGFTKTWWPNMQKQLEAMQGQQNNYLENTLTEGKIMQASIQTTKGEIKVELYGDKVPNTVANFVKLAKEGVYDGVYFHRVIADFMIQTGDPQAKGTAGVDFSYEQNSQNLPIAGTGGPGYAFADEFHPDLKHDKAGVLSMANSGPNTNGSQFFITHTATPWLDNVHSIFGQVVEGIEVVNKIAQGDKIEKIVILEE